MAGMKSGNILDKWRDYFRTSNSDIFDIIEHGIMVAASDFPQEFRLRRDGIAQILFSSTLTKCVGCDRVELLVPGEERDNDDEDDDNFKIGGRSDSETGRSKESKLDSGRNDHGDETNVNQMLSNYCYGDAEALTDEIEKESQMLGEVLRIKGIVGNSEDEPDLLLIDSLRRLELMSLSVEILKTTEIGKAVNALRKHGLMDIRHLARKLIQGWKLMVDEWVTATAIIAGASEGGTPESMNPSILDEEEGLPSPPLDDLVFFATQPTSMELSQFFDGMEDNENLGNIAEFNKNHESGRKPRVESPNIMKQRQRLPIEYITPPKDKKNEQTRKQEAPIKKQAMLLKPNKPSTAESGPGRPTKPILEHKDRNETKLQQKSEKATIQRPPVSQQNKSRCPDEASDQVKLEATKRKLQERYQQVENAKRQRTIQVMELHDLPKQGLGHKNTHVRPGNNHNRHWANGRR